MGDFISIVSPCFNEEQNIPLFLDACTKILDRYDRYEIILVDDGSFDRSLDVIRQCALKDSHVKYLALSRNFGHQNAVKAGLDHASGDAVISMDVDLQHPVEMIPPMIDVWKSGFDVVYTLREDDEKITFFKKTTSFLFYRFNNLISDVPCPPGAADFRLMDRKVVDCLKGFPENNLFLRGLVVWMGFRQKALPYRAASRKFGSSKYTIKKMLNLALAGAMNFSIKPLRVSVFIGGMLLFLVFIYAVYAVGIFIFSGKAVSGWTSLILVVIAMGSLQLMILGIICEYLGRLFLESKRRPNYIVASSNLKHER